MTDREQAFNIATRRKVSSRDECCREIEALVGAARADEREKLMAQLIETAELLDVIRDFGLGELDKKYPDAAIRARQP